MAGKRKRPTKAEAEALELHAALAWPPEPDPKPLGTEALEELVRASPTRHLRAWTFNMAGYVFLGATDGRDHHATGPMGKTSFNSKGPGGPWYLTRDDACLAMRWAMTRDAARQLLVIDARVKAYLASPVPSEAPDAAAPPSVPTA